MLRGFPRTSFIRVDGEDYSGVEFVDGVAEWRFIPETEGMKDGSDAIADWAILNALVNTAAGATWVSFHHGGGVGMGYSLHAGMVVVADGSERADHCLERVLTTDPGMGVIRHADAGYAIAKETAKAKGVHVPHGTE